MRDDAKQSFFQMLELNESFFHLMLIADSLFLKLVEPGGTLNFETPCPMAWGNLEGYYLGGWTSHRCLPNRVAWHPCALQYLLLRTEPWIYTWTVWAYKFCRGSKYFKVIFGPADKVFVDKRFHHYGSMTSLNKTASCHSRCEKSETALEEWRIFCLKPTVWPTEQPFLKILKPVPFAGHTLES